MKAIFKMLQRLWLWRTNKIWTWLESAILTSGILLFCYLANPADPLNTQGTFPWPWVAGIIIVLQHGFGPGLLSLVLVGSVAVFYTSINGISFPNFQEYLLSGLTVLLIAAVFSSSRVRRMMNAEEMLVYTNERLNSLSDSYYMLRLSYDYLEQSVITKPYTLRYVLKELQQLAIKQQGQITAEIAYPFLQVLSQFCSINSAGMYLSDKKGIVSEPLSEIGNIGHLDLHDPLIRESMDRQAMSYVSLNHLDNVNECKYLVSVPMMSHEGVLIGLIVIKDMSFWTLNDETLTTLSVLICYFVEEITCVEKFSDLLAIFPTCPRDFAQQLHKLMYLYKKLNITSVLCAVIVPKRFQQYYVIDTLQRQRRFPDSTWVLEQGDNDMILTLIPFSNATGVHGFFSRIEELLTVKFGLNSAKDGIKMRCLQLDDRAPLAFLEHFMTFIDVGWVKA